MYFKNQLININLSINNIMKKILYTKILILFIFKIYGQTGICLSPQTNYPSGTTPNGVIAADFNLDSKLDLVSANRNSNNISVFLNNGNGTFASAVNYATGGTPREVINSDFNTDGFTDIAVSNNSTNDVSVFFGVGNGTFLSAINYSVGTGPSDLISSDFNSDGKPDLAIANGTSSNVTILLNTGSGSFTSAVNYLAGSFPMSIKSADFNNDGKQDLAIANRNSNNVSLLFGIGNGSFAAAVNYTVGTGPWGIANGDFNGDGKPDLATSNITSNNVSVLLNNGSGIFLSAVNYPTGSTTSAIITADMNNDGKLDLAIPGGYILTGNSNGTFNNSVNYGVWGNKLAAGDLNSDNKTDLISTDNTNMVEVYLSTLILNVNVLGSDSLCAGGILTATGASTYSWSSGATTSTLMPTVSQIYSVTGTSLQCSNTSTISVYVKPLPIINASPSLTVCQNNSFTVTAVGGVSYAWTGPGSFTSNLQTNSIYLLGIGNSGTYSVTVTGTNNCVSKATTTITMKNQPNTTTMSGATSKCIGSSPTTVLCSGLNYTGVSWNSSPIGSILSFGGTLNNFININPTVTTVYNAIASYSNGCTYTNSYTVTVNPLPVISVNSGSICSGQSFTINPTGANTYTINGGSFVVSPTANTSYSISGTNSVGCVSNSFAVSSVSVSATPVISVNSGAICSSSSFTIIPSGASSYTYSSGSAIVSPTANTSYTVNGSSAVGCISNNVAVSSVTVNTLPIISISTTNTLLCAGQSASLTTTGANTYTWSTGINSNMITVSPTTNTTYTVFGSDGNGCNNTSVFTQSVSTCTGISSVSFNSQDVTIYPNPTNGFITIKDLKTATITVIDILGKQMKNIEFVNVDIKANITDLPNGIYYIEIKTDNGNSIKKIIKE